MGKRGPKPRPTPLRILSGMRPCRINASEPTAPPGAPDPPTVLTDGGRAHWGRLVARFEAMGVLSQIDGEALALLCNTLSLLEDAQRDIAERGMISRSAKGDRPNPAVRIAEKARVDALRMLAEFGGTPSARSRLTVANGKPQNQLEAFLEKHA